MIAIILTAIIAGTIIVVAALVGLLWALRRLHQHLTALERHILASALATETYTRNRMAANLSDPRSVALSAILADQQQAAAVAAGMKPVTQRTGLRASRGRGVEVFPAIAGGTNGGT